MAKPPSAREAILKLINAGTIGSKYTFSGILNAKYVWTGRILWTLHEEGIASVIGWERVYNQWTPIFAKQTNMPDAPKPAPNVRDYSIKLLHIPGVQQPIKRKTPTPIERRECVSEWYSALKQISG